MRVTFAALVCFRSLEVTLHAFPSPPYVSELFPFVEVKRVPAHVDHAVDSTETTEHLAPRPMNFPPLETRHRLGVVVPIESRVMEKIGDACGHLDSETFGRWAGFDK